MSNGTKLDLKAAVVVPARIVWDLPRGRASVFFHVGPHARQQWGWMWEPTDAPVVANTKAVSSRREAIRELTQMVDQWR